MLGTLSRLFSSLLSSLPPTVGASLLTISLPDVTKEVVEGLLVLYKEEWGEAKVKREVVELADMLGMPLCNSKLEEVEKDGKKKEEVAKENVPERDEHGESGVEDNSDDESVPEREPEVDVRKIKVEPEEVLNPKIEIEIDQIFGDRPAKKAEKKKNTIDELFKNLEMKILRKRTAGKVQESHGPLEEPRCPLCDSMFLSKEELRIHCGEVHLDSQLEAELLKIFPTDKCEECGQTVETEYVKKEHILVSHPWTGLIELVANKKKTDSAQLEDYNEDEVLFEDDSSDEEESGGKSKIENEKTGKVV